MLYENLEKLCGLAGVSGCEESVRYEILKLIEQHCIYRVDALGNILAFKKGAKAPTHPLLFSAHMDEVGLIVTFVEDSGLLRFDTVGGIDRRVLVGKAVRIGERVGVIGCKPVHMKTADEKDKAPALTDLYIDIGAKDAAQAKEHVTAGDRAVFTSNYTEFGDGFLRGRALDDRIGCALMVELLQSDLAYDAHFAFTVQEETGTTGGKTAAAQIGAEIAIVIETTTACDIPAVEGDKRVCALRKGPVVSYMDRGTVYDMGLYTRAMAIAAAENIPCQTKSGVYGGNEARSIQVAGDGARVLAVSAPCRYLHTPSCVAHTDDIGGMLRLLTALLADFAA